jgi:hypothetical protein
MPTWISLKRETKSSALSSQLLRHRLKIPSWRMIVRSSMMLSWVGSWEARTSSTVCHIQIGPRLVRSSLPIANCMPRKFLCWHSAEQTPWTRCIDQNESQLWRTWLTVPTLTSGLETVRATFRIIHNHNIPRKAFMVAVVAHADKNGVYIAISLRMLNLAGCRHCAAERG